MGATPATTAILAALRFAAQKHRDERRKGADAAPYINHPIGVAELLARVGGIADVPTLQAAILHDTLEDTATTPAELDEHFGVEVRKLVQELTDDKSRPKAERKRLQAEHAPRLSVRAKPIKIADKIYNVGDLTPTDPPDWTRERKLEYLAWAERVVAGCRGCNAGLEQEFDRTLQAKRPLLATR